VDRFLTTVVAGVIVAIIGAIIAYYFGGVREKQKQTYEMQKEQKREREEKRKEDNARRAEALTEIRNQALPLGEALKGWANSVARLPKKIPTTAKNEDWLRFGREVTTLLHQRDSASNNMSDLKSYYWAQKPYLEAKQRSLVEPFATEFDGRYTALSKYLDDVLLSQGNRSLA
jgi:hypothetical protein